MSKEEYEVKGMVKFAYTKEGLATNTVNYAEWEKEIHGKRDVYDLMTGEEFLEKVDDGLFIDYDGIITDIFVDGYKSNLGLCHEGICQGCFLVDGYTFAWLCEEHTIEVNWSNR